MKATNFARVNRIIKIKSVCAKTGNIYIFN